MKIILSTRNPSKAEQIKAIFAELPVTILTLDETDIEGEAIEDGSTLDENSLLKAMYAYEHSDMSTWTMADDTGFYITALNGQPGIKAARWAGETATTDDITQHTLKLLEGANDRSAYFKTVVALISPEGDQYFFNGRVDGHILEAPRVKPQPKMPYSPIFVPQGHDKVWAQMEVDEENAISHRGKAFRMARDFLKNYLA